MEPSSVGAFDSYTCYILFVKRRNFLNYIKICAFKVNKKLYDEKIRIILQIF